MRIAENLAAVIPGRRDPSRIVHALPEILLACMLAIACGYEDADDLDYLCADPAFTFDCGRLPESGADLMRQPTISRSENNGIAPVWWTVRGLGQAGSRLTVEACLPVRMRRANGIRGPSAGAADL